MLKIHGYFHWAVQFGLRMLLMKEITDLTTSFLLWSGFGA